MPSVTRQSTRVQAPVALPNGESDLWGQLDTIRMLLYGKSGTGKTTLWATFPKPILALICSGGKKPGELRSINTPEYRKTIFPKLVSSCAQFNDLLADAPKYATIVLDHASGLQDLTLVEILGTSEIPSQRTWGMATMQEWGQSNRMVIDMCRSLLNLSGNVIIVAQERLFKAKETGVEDLVIQPTIGAGLSPGVVEWLNPACDYVVEAFHRPRMRTIKITVGETEQEQQVRGAGVDFCLRTAPHDIYHSKFRLPRGKTALPEFITNPTYGKILKLSRGEELE